MVSQDGVNFACAEPIWEFQLHKHQYIATKLKLIPSKNRVPGFICEYHIRISPHVLDVSVPSLSYIHWSIMTEIQTRV